MTADRSPLRTVTATRYVTPLREGGSLPAIMEADDLGTYVVKFVGAGQGRKVLVAEVIAAELARALGLPVPALALVDVDPLLGLAEPDAEVQDLLRASAGANLGTDFLPGALGFDPVVHRLDAALAARVLWFDAYLGNVDRSWRNPNLLMWHRRPWLIDHGASLTFHHDWSRAPGFVERPYDASDHVLVDQVEGETGPEGERLAASVAGELLEGVLARVPDAWLADEPGFESPASLRAAYVELLLRRLDARERWRP